MAFARYNVVNYNQARYNNIASLLLNENINSNDVKAFDFITNKNEVILSIDTVTKAIIDKRLREDIRLNAWRSTKQNPQNPQWKD